MLNASLGLWETILKAILEFRLFGSSASVAFILITIVPGKHKNTTLFTPPRTGIYLYCNLKGKSILLDALHNFLMLLTLFNA